MIQIEKKKLVASGLSGLQFMVKRIYFRFIQRPSKICNHTSYKMLVGKEFFQTKFYKNQTVEHYESRLSDG